MVTHIINYSSEDIVESKVISYYTDNEFCNNNEINLNVVMEYKIRHPESEGRALFLRTDVERVGTFKRSERPDLILLEASMKNTHSITESINKEKERVIEIEKE